jgi:hypothetical protein
MDSSGRDPLIPAKMPGVFGGLRCDWNRSRPFDLKRDVSADGPIDPRRDRDIIPGGESPAPFYLSDMGMAPISGATTSVNHVV